MPSLFLSEASGRLFNWQCVNQPGTSVCQTGETLDQQMTWEWGKGSGERGLNLSASCNVSSLLVSLAASAIGGISGFNRDFTGSATQTTLNC